MSEIITLDQGQTHIEIVAARGAIVSALVVDGQAILFMDLATLADPSKNVRGGIPLLFPFAGRLVDDTLVATGGRIKQHGFGRDRAWSVAARGAASVTMTLASDAETRALFPWDFRASLAVRALDRGLRIELAVENTGTTPLPMSPGWHPYFTCATDAKAAFHADVNGLPRGVVDDTREHDFGVFAPSDGIARLDIDALALILSFAPTLRHLQVWTLPGRPFVCVEPFWGPADTINGPARAEVMPGDTQVVWMAIEA